MATTEAVRLAAVVVGDTSHAERALGAFGGKVKTFAQDTGSVMAGVLGANTVQGIVRGALNVGKAVLDMGMEYEDAMNMAQAVTSGTAEEMRQMGQVAMALGNDLTLPATSAGDAANAMVELAKAGLDVNETMAAAKGTLQLAAAGAIDEATAAKITAQALNAFNLEGKEATRVADLLAAAANASSAEVSDMAYGVQQAGAVFNSAGMSIDELATSMGIMSNAGIQGSDAATSLRTMILKLQNPSEEAASMIKTLGISVYDTAGNMKPMRGLIDEVSAKTGNLTQESRNMALATIFGSDAIRSANIVLAGGTDKWDDMSGAVHRANAAQELAEARTRGLRGAIGAVTNQLETMALGVYMNVVPAMTAMAKGVAGGITQVGKLAGAIADEISPAVEAFGRVVEAGWPAVKTMLTVMGGFTGAAIIGAFTALNAVVTPVLNFMADHEVVVQALAILFAAKLATGVMASVKAFMALEKLRVQIWLLGVSQALSGMSANMAQAAGFTGKLRAGMSSLGGVAGTAKGGLLALVAALVYMGYESAKARRNKEAEEFLEGITKNADSAKDRLNAVSKAMKDFEGTKSGGFWKDFANPKSLIEMDDHDKHQQSVEKWKALEEEKRELQKMVRAEERAASKERADEHKAATAALADAYGKQGAAAIEASGMSVTAMQETAEAAAESSARISESFNAATDVVSHFAGETTVAGADIKKFYEEQIKQAQNWATNLDAAMKMGLKEGVIRRIAEAGPEAAGLLQAIVSDTSGGMVDMVNANESALSGILTQGKSTMDTIGMLAAQSTDKTRAHMDEAYLLMTTNAANGGKMTVEALAEKLKMKVEDVRKIGAEYGLGFKSEAVAKMAEAGRAMIDGLKAGIAERWNGALEAARGLARSITGAFSGILKSKSPSKVFIGFGHDIVNGLVIGMDPASAARASGHLGNAVVNGFGSNVIAGPWAGSGAGSVTVEVHVDARGATDPQAVGQAVGTGVEDAISQVLQRKRAGVGA